MKFIRNISIFDIGHPLANRGLLYDANKNGQNSLNVECYKIDFSGDGDFYNIDNNTAILSHNKETTNILLRFYTNHNKQIHLHYSIIDENSISIDISSVIGIYDEIKVRIAYNL